MRLDLSTSEANILHDLLHAYLPDLRREVARTENREFRHTMEQRQEICERILQALEAEGVIPEPDSGPIIAAPAA